VFVHEISLRLRNGQLAQVRSISLFANQEFVKQSCQSKILDQTSYHKIDESDYSEMRKNHDSNAHVKD
jgi:hypothetical protein